MIGKARSAEGATYAARLVTGRAVLPHLARAVGIMEASDGVADAVSSKFTPLGFDQKRLDVVLNGMYDAVNEPHGTPIARASRNLELAMGAPACMPSNESGTT